MVMYDAYTDSYFSRALCWGWNNMKSVGSSVHTYLCNAGSCIHFFYDYLQIGRHIVAVIINTNYYLLTDMCRLYCLSNNKQWHINIIGLSQIIHMNSSKYCSAFCSKGKYWTNVSINDIETGFERGGWSFEPNKIDTHFGEVHCGRHHLMSFCPRLFTKDSSVDASAILISGSILTEVWEHSGCKGKQNCESTVETRTKSK